VAAAIAYFGIVTGTAIGPYPWATRIAITVYGLWFYVIKTLLPVGLSPLYEIPVSVSLLEPRMLSALLGVAGVSFLVVRLRRRWPAGLAVWLYYAIVLAPVSGLLVTPGLSVPSDRYSYLSGLGLALLVGAGLGAVLRAPDRGVLRPSIARLAGVAVLVWLVGLGTLAWRQVHVWRDTESLWRYAVTVAPDCANCHNNLGVVLLRQNAPSAALVHFQEAARLRPHHLTVHGANTALALTRLGRLPEAVEEYDRVLAVHPDTLDVRLSVATLLWRMDRREEAVQRLRQGLAVTPVHPAVHASLGAALLEVGRPAEAVEHFRRALALEPAATAPRVGLVRAHARLGQGDLARAELAALRARNPELARQVDQALPAWEAGGRPAP
jgi:Tfp pilus assembly protein PilF